MCYMSYVSIICNKSSRNIKVQKLISGGGRPRDKSEIIFRLCKGRRDGGGHSWRETQEEHCRVVRQAQRYMQVNAGSEHCQLGLDTTTLPSGEFSPRLVYLMMSCRGKKMSTQPTTLM